MTDSPRIYYFGYNGSGHHMVNEGFEVLPWSMKDDCTPWGMFTDGTLCPDLKGYQTEGVAALHHKDGWTALAFWDRSGDKRFNSNSAFFTQGEYTFEEMLAIAKERFGGVFARIKFQIVENK